MYLEKSIPFIAFIISYSFGSYIFLREPNLTINRLFMLIIITPFITNFFELLYWQKIISIELLNFTKYFSVWLLPPLYIHFIYCFLNKLISKRLIIFYVIAIFGVFTYHILNISFLNAIYLFLSIIVLLYLWYRETKNLSTDLNKLYQVQCNLIFVGFLINYIFLSILENDIFDDLTNLKLLSPLIIVTFIASALLKVRLNNILYILKKSTIYAIFIFIFVFSYIVGIVYLFNFFQLINNEYAIYYTALFLVPLAIIFQPIVEYIRNFIDSHIFKTPFNYKQIVENFSKQVLNLTSSNELIILIGKTFIDAFKLSNGFFLNIKLALNEKIIFFTNEIIQIPDEINNNLERIISIRKDIFQPLLVDYIFYEINSHEEILIIYDFLIKNKIAIIIPLVNENVIIGMFFLGYKYMKEDYNDDDLQLITTILNQSQVALNSIRLYENLILSKQELEKTIEKLQSTQNELAKSEKLAALGHFAANIAHEVKNPLSIIKISALNLSNSLNDKPKLKEMADFINKEIDRLNSFISQLLFFAKEKELILIDFEINELIDELIKNIQMYILHENKKINIKKEINLTNEKLFIYADYEQLLRAFLNICFNAVDAITQNDGIIVIRINKNEQENKVVIEVEDNGCGIEEDKVNNCFQPFFTTKKKGTGLGLTVANQIIEKHNGKIEIFSKKDFGTKVVITIPIKVMN